MRHRGDSVTVYTCPWCSKTGKRRGISQPVVRRCGHCLKHAKLVGGEYRKLYVEFRGSQMIRVVEANRDQAD